MFSNQQQQQQQHGVSGGGSDAAMGTTTSAAPGQQVASEGVMSSGFDDQQPQQGSASLKSNDASETRQRQRMKSQQTTINLRRKKTEEILNKRRTDDLELGMKSNNDLYTSNNTPNFCISPTFASNKNLSKYPLCLSIDQLNEIVLKAQNLQGQELFDYILIVRKSISNPEARKLNPDAHIDSIINSNFLNFITKVLDESTDDGLSYEAIWILINVAAGNHRQTYSVVQCGALDVLFNKLDGNISITLVDHILWCISNIIGDGAKLRDLTMKKGLLMKIYDILFKSTEEVTISVKKNIGWILSNTLRPVNNPIEEKDLELVMDMVDRLVTTCPGDRTDIMYDCIWALFYSLNNKNGVEKHKIIARGFHKFLLECMTMEGDKIPKTALRATTLLSAGEDDDIQELLNCNLIEIAANLYETRDDSFKPDVLIIYGNIALGWHNQKSELIKHPIFASILSQIPFMSDKIQTEALFVVAHIIDSKSVDFLKELLEMHPNLLEMFFFSLKTQTKDWQLVTRNLNSLDFLLSSQGSLNQDISLMLEKDGALTAIENYQHGCPDQVFAKVGNIIDQYFTPDEFLDNYEQNKLNANSAAGLFDGKSFEGENGGMYDFQ